MGWDHSGIGPKENKHPEEIRPGEEKERDERNPAMSSSGLGGGSLRDDGTDLIGEVVGRQCWSRNEGRRKTGGAQIQSSLRGIGNGGQQRDLVEGLEPLGKGSVPQKLFRVSAWNPCSRSAAVCEKRGTEDKEGTLRANKRVRGGVPVWGEERLRASALWPSLLTFGGGNGFNPSGVEKAGGGGKKKRREKGRGSGRGKLCALLTLVRLGLSENIPS